MKAAEREQLIDALAGSEAALAALAADPKVLQAAHAGNCWFTPGMVRAAVAALLPWLDRKRLQDFAAQYPEPPAARSIGIIMAGNVPLVGLHDLLCVLLSGHRALLRLSHKDHVLPAAYVAALPPLLADRIDILPDIPPEAIDYLLATGSDNTARYLAHRYAAVPKLIRRNRFSVAVLDGRESAEALEGLARDILLYHGMGCRSVSHLFVPEGWTPEPLCAALQACALDLAPEWREVVRWERAEQAMHGTPQTCGDAMVLEWVTEPRPARIGMLHLQRYAAGSGAELMKVVKGLDEKLQCVVPEAVAFGGTQRPELNDFADGVDVMRILSEDLVGHQ